MAAIASSVYPSALLSLLLPAFGELISFAEVFVFFVLFFFLLLPASAAMDAAPFKAIPYLFRKPSKCTGAEKTAWSVMYLVLLIVAARETAWFGWFLWQSVGHMIVMPFTETVWQMHLLRWISWILVMMVVPFGLFGWYMFTKLTLRGLRSMTVDVPNQTAFSQAEFEKKMEEGQIIVEKDGVNTPSDTSLDKTLEQLPMPSSQSTSGATLSRGSDDPAPMTIPNSTTPTPIKSEGIAVKSATGELVTLGTSAAPAGPISTAQLSTLTEQIGGLEGKM